jgi:hypothetical protein
MATAPRAAAGDLIEIHGHRVGEPRRIGEILEILGVCEQERYRVRWDDGRESIYTRGSDAVIRHARTDEVNGGLVSEP